MKQSRKQQFRELAANLIMASKQLRKGNPVQAAWFLGKAASYNEANMLLGNESNAIVSAMFTCADNHNPLIQTELDAAAETIDAIIDIVESWSRCQHPRAVVALQRRR